MLIEGRFRSLMNRIWNNLPIEIPEKTNYNEATETNLEKEAAKCADELTKNSKVEWILNWAINHTAEEINLLISLYQSSLPR